MMGLASRTVLLPEDTLGDASLSSRTRRNMSCTPPDVRTQRVREAAAGLIVPHDPFLFARPPVTRVPRHFLLCLEEAEASCHLPILAIYPLVIVRLP